jgi:hypothetical protein
VVGERGLCNYCVSGTLCRAAYSVAGTDDMNR